MDLNDYQTEAIETAVYPEEYNIIYPALGLTEEAGEVSGKVAKMLRDGIPLEKQKEKIIAEMGDVLWMLSALAFDCKIEMRDVARANLKKLRKRKEANTLHGEGDDR